MMTLISGAFYSSGTSGSVDSSDFVRPYVKAQKNAIVAPRRLPRWQRG
jgi:hypothetical protein